jgi:glycine betaine/proline transport system ATP-binding protein
VFITHDLQEALKLGDQVAIMKEGRFVQSGTPQEIVIKPAEDYVYEFTKDVDRSRVLTFNNIMKPATQVAPDAPVTEIRRQLSAGVAFVVDEAGRPIGVIGADQLNGAGDQHKASSLMADDFAQVEVGRYIFEAFDHMSTHRPLAVVGSAGELIGMVNPPDVFAHLKQVARPTKREAQPQPS